MEFEFAPPVAPVRHGFRPLAARADARRARQRSPILAPGARSAAARFRRSGPPWPRPTSRRFRRRRGSAPAVHAAYLVDVEGVSPRRLVSSGLFDFSSDRSARHHVRDGRLTAADLGAWPWAVVDGKPLPRNWWADRDFALALQEWAGAPSATCSVCGRAATPRRRGCRSPDLRATSQGADRNRTGVNGFAGRCVTTPPRRRSGSSVASAHARKPSGPGLYWALPADVAQLARASACHAEGRGFESHHPLSTRKGPAEAGPFPCESAVCARSSGT